MNKIIFLKLTEDNCSYYIFIVVIYCVGIIAISQFVSKSKQGHEKTAEDYFLAGR